MYTCFTHTQTRMISILLYVVSLYLLARIRHGEEMKLTIHLGSKLNSHSIVMALRIKKRRCFHYRKE